MNKYEVFFNKIEEFDKIVIFGHVAPDGDCYGSSQGLKELIKYYYPKKKVLVTGTDFPKAPFDYPRADIVTDEDLEGALFISVDLPDLARASDKRLANKAPYKIKIDHHIYKETFADLEIIDESKASCAEIVAELFYSRNEKLPQMALNLLYLGFTTDTKRFLYAKRVDIATGSRLIEEGADYETIYEALYSRSEKSIRFSGYLCSSYSRTDIGLVYIKIPYETTKLYGYTPHSCAVFVNTLETIGASRMWVIIAEDENHGAYCEFRSRGIDVQSIASSFGGGGHLEASGCYLKDFSRADEVIKACNDACYSYYAPYDKELKVMLDLAKKASNKILEIYNKGFNVEIKEDKSPVTDADFASDKIIKEGLTENFKDIPVLSEEEKDDLTRLNSSKVFVIDPLDGTADFVDRTDQFAINLALVEDHEPVIGVVAIPCQKRIYFAVKSKGSYTFSEDEIIRKIHVSSKKDNLKCLTSSHHTPSKLLEKFKESKKISKVEFVGSSLKACLIAEGKAEVTYSIGNGTKEWDTCAPQLVLQEAGGSYTDVYKKAIKYNREHVRNETGFMALNHIDNSILSDEELEVLCQRKA